MKEESALLASLLTFQDLIYALDGAWVVSGLGHDYGLDIQGIKKAAVLHYNGNMKPWLDRSGNSQIQGVLEEVFESGKSISK